METTHKQSWKAFLPLMALVPLYLATRKIALTVLPMTSLEATWIHWAQIIVQYPNEWLISSIGDRQPLFTWLNAVTLNIFSDPLAAGRWVSVLAGLASLAGLYFIGRDLSHWGVGSLAAFSYIIFPYTFFYDRLALPDSLLLALVIWIFRWAMHIVRGTKPHAKAFKILGILMGAALLTNISVGFLFPAPVIAFYFFKVHKRPEFWKQLGSSAGIALVMSSPVLLNASDHASDRFRYGEGGMSAGMGIHRAAEFLAKEAEVFHKKTGVPLPVLLPMSPGHPAEGITVYLWNNPDVRFVPVFWWPKSPRLIPTGLRFSHRPSIYQTSPVMRRETTLLDYAHFIFPGSGYSPQKFLQENPRFQEAWSLQGRGSRRSMFIFKYHPKK